MRRFAVLSLAAVSLTAVPACRGGRPTPATVASAQTPAPVAAAADATVFTGAVAETMSSGGYTYARLQAAGKDDVWIAAPEFRAKTGDRLTVALEMPMRNFESRTLRRTFALVYFVSDVTRDGQPLIASSAGAVDPAAMAAHAPAVSAAAVDPVAPPPGGLSIADVWAKRTALAGRAVTVRGTAVKVNDGILGRNWVHLQDGSGSADDRSNDLTITTSETVAAGSVITATGVLAVDKDFGAGYKYSAIVENATILK